MGPSTWSISALLPQQRTGERGKEPLRTLATYRRAGEKVLFGMNAMGAAQGVVRVGDEVTVLS